MLIKVKTDESTCGNGLEEDMVETVLQTDFISSMATGIIEGTCDISMSNGRLLIVQVPLTRIESVLQDRTGVQIADLT